MLNPTVPVIGPKVAVIGPKVTVMGSKVTEMLKRKLQQRLLADKTKKAKTSEGEKEPPLLSTGSGTGTTTASSVTGQPDHPMFVQGTNVALVSCAGSYANISNFISHLSFASENNSHGQQTAAKTLNTNKTKTAKSKSSKSKKSQKTSATRCSSTTVGTASTDMSSTDISGVNPNICNINGGVIPECKGNCPTIPFGGTGFDPRSTNLQNCGALTNGVCGPHTGFCKSKFAVPTSDAAKSKFPCSFFNMGSFKDAPLAGLASDSSSEKLMGTILANSSTSCINHHPTPMDDSSGKTLPGTDTKSGILKDSMAGDKGNVLSACLDDSSRKKVVTSDGANSGLIDSSLWPLLYGENSKQLDDYIHRIYCRDCQKSREQFRSVGDKADGALYLRRSSVGAHSEVKTCQLQSCRNLDGNTLCSSRNLQMDVESTELAIPAEQSLETLKSEKMSPVSMPSSDWKASSLFKDQSNLQMHSAIDGVSNPPTESSASLQNLTLNSQAASCDTSKGTDRVTEPMLSKALASENSGNVLTPTASSSDIKSMKTKKLSSKSAPKVSNKVIKFHEYKGPPNVSRPACTIAMPPSVRSPPLKDDMYQKLQQRQLCLQMQLQMEFRNHQLMASLAGHNPSSCELRNFRQIYMNKHQSPLSIDSLGREPVGQPALAPGAFTSMNTPLLLTTASAVVTSPLKFVSPIGNVSNQLQPVGVPFTAGVPLTASIPLTTGTRCIASSFSVAGGVSTCTLTSSALPSQQSPLSWSNKCSVPDNTSIQNAACRPGNEPMKPLGVTQSHVIIASSTSCTVSIQSVCQAIAVQSTTALVASAMTSAPILSAGGGKMPSNSMSPVVASSSKTKNTAGNSPAAAPPAASANRCNTVLIPTRLEDVKVADLKAECRKRKLVVSGPKPNLIERLRPYEDDILRCLAVNLRAASQEAESSNDDKNPLAVGGDQTSSPSSLTSMESVVHIQPLCPLNDEDSSGIDFAAMSKPTLLTPGKEMNLPAPGKARQSLEPLVRKSLNFPVPLCVGVNPTAASPAKSNVGRTTPIAGVSSCINGLQFATSPSLEKVPEAHSTVEDQPRKPSASLALPSVSLWYGMPPVARNTSIPASGSTLPNVLLQPIPANRFVNAPTASCASAGQTPPTPLPCASLSSSPLAIPLSTSYVASQPSGYPFRMLSAGPSQPTYQLFQVAKSGPGSLTIPGASTSVSSTVVSSEISKSCEDVPPGLSSSSNQSALWPVAAGTAKPGLTSGIELNGTARPQILTSNDLLNWQQHQIQELQKQLHLSRLQLLETHRRVWEQQEQFQARNSVQTHGSASSSMSYYGEPPVVADGLKSSEENSLGVFDYGNALQNIPSLDESPACDVTEELFEDFGASISPISGCVRTFQGDVAGPGSAGLEGFGDSCAELLSKEMGDHEADDVGHLSRSFLSPGFDNSSHSMLEMCALESGVPIEETVTKESVPDMSSRSEEEKLDHGSFYLPVPLKEPPKYDDVVKCKQTTSTLTSSSTVAVAANCVDDLLQMLMRQTDAQGNTTMADQLLSSDGDILSNTSPATFTSPVSLDAHTDESTPQEMDVYPYSASSNSSSSGIGTAPSTCGDLLNDPLGSSGMSSSMFSEIPFQLPDWTDCEFLELSMLEKIKLDQTDDKAGDRSHHAMHDFTSVVDRSAATFGNVAAPKTTPPSNEYDPCLAGFGPSYMGDSLGFNELLDAEMSGLPPCDSLNGSRSYEMLEDIFTDDADDIFQDSSCFTADRRLDIGSISTN